MCPSCPTGDVRSHRGLGWSSRTRGCGGRLATQRVSVVHEEDDGEQPTIFRLNMGAPRLHFSTAMAAPGSNNTDDDLRVQQELIHALEAAGVVEVHYCDRDGRTVTNHGSAPTDGGILRPRGASNEMCRWMLSDANVHTRFRSRLRSIDRHEQKDIRNGTRQQFRVSLFGNKNRDTRKGNSNKSKSATEVFDAVVFAGSPAEVKTTYGDMQAWTKPMWRYLKPPRVQHTRTCCLGPVFRDHDDDDSRSRVLQQIPNQCFPNGATVLVIGDDLPGEDWAKEFDEVHDLIPPGDEGEERRAWWQRWSGGGGEA